MEFEITTNVLDKYSQTIKSALQSFEQISPLIPHPFSPPKNFIGRKAEREMLTNWYKHSPPMFFLVSISGMGKTSLAWQWLHEELSKQEEAPKGIIWWSFQEENAGFDQFLHQALKYVGNDRIDPRLIPSPRERMECLYGLLVRKRFLLVLDGLERLLQAYSGLSSVYAGNDFVKDNHDEYRTCPDANLADFLKNLANHYTKTKTLITSRLFPQELDRLPGCNRYHLRQFTLDSALDFFFSEGLKYTKEEIKIAAAPLGYHPLALKLFCSLIKEDAEYQGQLAPALNIRFIREGARSDLKTGDKIFPLLSFLYDRLPDEEKNLLGMMSVMRSPLTIQGLMSFVPPESNEERLKNLLKRLLQRGLIFHVPKSERYGLFPIVHKYAYERLENKASAHAKLLQYIKTLPIPATRETIADFYPEIEIFHHLIKAGFYDDAADLFNDRLAPLYFIFSAYLVCIDLLSAFFPSGAQQPPGFKGEMPQGWARDALALCYSSCGKPLRAIPLMQQAAEIYASRGNKRRAAIILGNLAQDKTAAGELEAAALDLEHCLRLCREIGDELMTAVAHQDMGLLKIYQGDFDRAGQEINLSSQYSRPHKDEQGLCIDEAHRALTAIIQEDYGTALDAAHRARRAADKEALERDFIRTEWLLGWAYWGRGQLDEGENHLSRALTYCHKINYIELEAVILLGIARVWHSKIHLAIAPVLKDASGDAIPKHKIISKALTPVQNLAREAIVIANRCQYRLQQAEIHLFLAQLSWECGDKFKARREADLANKLAACGFKSLQGKIKEFVGRLSG
ncbi:MAG: hypothetical protein HZA78_07680 [Candidatus Schekmanbacteria bacterium]|nr:hypothetical protein [Candidatus Schekmanbacteria bacterium]